MNKIKLLSIISCMWCSTTVMAYELPNYGDQVIKNKMYSKFQRIEFSGGGSIVMNEPFTETYFGGGSGAFFINDEWGIEIVGGVAFVQDKSERLVLENWTNIKSTKETRYVPVYPELIESKYFGAINVIFTPLYAKQLLLFKMITNFDVYVSGGLGATGLTYYPKFKAQDQDPNFPGRDQTTLDLEKFGYTADQTERYGKLGRQFFYSTLTSTVDQVAPTLNFGFGQRYFFLKYFNFKFDIKDYIILVKNEKSEYTLFNKFVMWLGVGGMF